jgi:hypothetical protein
LVLPLKYSTLATVPSLSVAVADSTMPGVCDVAAARVRLTVGAWFDGGVMLM